MNETLFPSLHHARATLAAWRTDYNTERPHSRLDWQTPAEFARTFAPQRGLGGGFRFCRLGQPLFDEFGDVASEVTFPDLAAHVFFAETGAPIPARASGPLLGAHGDRAVYLLFDAAHPGTPREAVGNVLTPARLADLPPPPDGFDGLRVVYAEGCTVSADRLKAAGVVFRQIPYQIEGV